MINITQLLTCIFVIIVCIICIRNENQRNKQMDVIFKRIKERKLFMNKWINVKDQMPVNHDYVLAYLRILYGECKVCFYHDRNFYATNVDDEVLTRYITHWMPLPQPPETKNEQST